MIFYVHRVLRLMPVFAFLMLLYLNVSKYVGQGYIWDQYVVPPFSYLTDLPFGSVTGVALASAVTRL